MHLKKNESKTIKSKNTVGINEAIPVLSNESYGWEVLEVYKWERSLWVALVGLLP